MSRKVWIPGLTGFLTVVWVLAGGVSSIRAEASRPETGTLRTITVVGEGKVSVRPDVAKANIGVVVTAPTVKEAVSRNRASMTAVLAALKRLGVAEKDILTSNYSIT